jgi:hypothetical protein
MCIRTKDLKIATNKPCYLTHPKRNDEIDDVLLDTANQLELSKQDLILWATSFRSYDFLEELGDSLSEIENRDFQKELHILQCVA